MPFNLLSCYAQTKKSAKNSGLLWLMVLIPYFFIANSMTSAITSLMSRPAARTC